VKITATIISTIDRNTSTGEVGSNNGLFNGRISEENMIEKYMKAVKNWLSTIHLQRSETLRDPPGEKFIR